MALTAGTKLGPYEILAMLGAGGMGEVYRALDTRLDRTVAVKVLASHLSSSPELKQRMEREAKAISSLNHRHICHLYDIGSQDGTDYGRRALSHEGVGGVGGRRARCGRERAVLDHARCWARACGRPLFDRPAGEHLA